MRPCPGRPERGERCGVPTARSRCPRHESGRNADPRRDIYRGDWAETSRRLRAAQPWCSVVGCTSRDLTVDHVLMRVLCRSHHAMIENERRAGGRVGS